MTSEQTPDALSDYDYPELDSGSAPTVPAKADAPEAANSESHVQDGGANHKHPEALLKMCDVLGIGRELAAQFDGDQLDRLLSETMDNAKSVPTEGDVPTDKPEWADVKLPWPEGTSDEDYDDTVTVVLKRMKLEFQKELEALREPVNRAAQLETRRAQEQNLIQIDAGFAELNSPLLGGTRSRNEVSDDVRNRRILVLKSLKENPIPGIPLKAAVAKRAREIYGLPAGRSIAATASARPTPRKMPELPKGKDRAVAFLDRQREEEKEDLEDLYSGFLD